MKNHKMALPWLLLTIEAPVTQHIPDTVGDSATVPYVKKQEKSQKYPCSLEAVTQHIPDTYSLYEETAKHGDAS